MRCKWLLVLVLCCAGCLPASQQEVADLTNLVEGIVPLVKTAVSESSEDTKNKIDVVLGQIVEVNEAVATAEDPVEAIEKGWDASKAWNPYYGYGVLGLGILRLFQKKKLTTTALEEVVLGIEDAKKDGNGTASLKASLNASESTATRKMVKKILG